MHWEKPSHHKIEGIGDGFIPKIIENHLDLVDEVLQVNKLDDRFTASPVMVGSEIYLRGHKYLYCIAKK